MVGSDDEKTRLLKDLAIGDFHFARRFPVPESYPITLDTTDVGGGKQSRKGLTGVNPLISGLAQLEYFKEALDVMPNELSTRRLGKIGSETKMPAVNRKNLLSGVTHVHVDASGIQIPDVADSRQVIPPSPVANLWAFCDENANEIYALSGRGYMVHGSDSERFRILKALAPYDFPMAKTTPANHPVSSDSKYAKFMFNDVLHEIEGAIPRTIGLDGQIRNPVIITAERLTINATQITEQSSRVPRVSRCSRPGSSLKMTLSKFFHQHRNRLIRDDDRRLSPIPGLENRETWGTLRDFCPRRGSRPSFGR